MLPRIETTVGAQIGIHNLKGEKVGTVGKLRNKEHIFIVGSGVDITAMSDLKEPALDQLALFSEATR